MKLSNAFSERDLPKLTEFFNLLIEIDRKGVVTNGYGITTSDRESLKDGLQENALRSNKTRHPRA